MLNSTRKLFTYLLLGMLLSCAALGVSAQSDDEVIIEGNPSLTRSELDKAVRVLETLFGTRFDGDEPATIRYYGGHDAERGRNGVIRGLKTIARLDGEIQKASEEQVARARDLLIADLRAAKDSEVYTFLLEVFEAAQNKKKSPATVSNNSSSQSDTDRRVEVLKDGGTIRDLLGKWERKTAGMSSYTGGVYQGSSGNYEAYEFFADGRVAYTTLIAVQNYNCRLEAFAQSAGRASVAGAELKMNFLPGKIRREDSCSPSKNYTKPTDATNNDFKWRIERDEYGNIQLALTDSDGKTFLYRKAQ